MRDGRFACLPATAYRISTTSGDSTPTRQLGVYWTTEPWISELGEAVYPPIARSARVAGPVVLSLTLDRRGKVTGAEALSGAPLLAPAALAHARTWRLASYGRLPRQLVVV